MLTENIVQLSRASSGLVLTLADGRSVSDVQVVRAAPLSAPDGFIAFLDAGGHEVCLVRDLSDLPPESRTLVKQELQARYLISAIQKVRAFRREGGTLYLQVETDRGGKELVVQHSDESVRWLDDHSLLLIDVDGNRFELRDLNALDRASARILTENLPSPRLTH